jgi:hypothetical protein
MTPTAFAGPWFARLPVKPSYLAIPNREPEHANAVRSLGRQMDRICSVVDLHERYPAIAQIGGSVRVTLDED